MSDGLRLEVEPESPATLIADAVEELASEAQPAAMPDGQEPTERA